eukprot:14090892-Ditylum_brightwellii.AAC.1
MYEPRVFLNNTCLHQTINNAVRSVACSPVNGKNTVHTQCALGVCKIFPSFNGPEEEQVAMLGKHNCKDQWRQAFINDENAVVTKSNYVE